MGPESLGGLGTKDEQLMRVHVLNSKQELQAINILYEETYGVTLEDAVKHDTSGDYMKLLLALLEPK
jgi:hypothetical protein